MPSYRTSVFAIATAILKRKGVKSALEKGSSLPWKKKGSSLPLSH